MAEHVAEHIMRASSFPAYPKFPRIRLRSSALCGSQGPQRSISLWLSVQISSAVKQKDRHRWDQQYRQSTHSSDLLTMNAPMSPQIFPTSWRRSSFGPSSQASLFSPVHSPMSRNPSCVQTHSQRWCVMCGISLRMSLPSTFPPSSVEPKKASTALYSF